MSEYVLSIVARGRDEASGVLRGVSGALASVGRVASGALAAVGAGFLATTGAATTFEQSFTGVRKTVDMTEAELATLEAGLLTMASAAGTATASLRDAPNVLANIAQSAGQLGVQGTEAILKFTETVAMIGISTNLTTDEAASAFARFGNIMQMPMEQVDRLGATVVDLGNNMATTEQEIMSMALRLAGAGRTVGMTEAQVLGLAGALSSVGIEAEMGGSAMSRVMVEMANAVASGGEALTLFAGTAGMSAAAFADAFRDDPAAAIVAFVQGLEEIQASGGNVFATLDSLALGEIRVRDALLRLAGSSSVLTGALDIANDAWRENTALLTEAGRFAETTGSGWQQLRNYLAVTAITVGTALLPVMQTLMGMLSELALRVGPVVIDWAQRFGTWFASLDAPLQRASALIAAVATALGGLSTAGSLLGPVFGGLATKIAGLAGPVGVAIAAAGALYAAWQTNFGGLRDTLEPVIAQVQQALPGALWVAQGALASLSGETARARAGLTQMESGLFAVGMALGLNADEVRAFAERWRSAWTDAVAWVRGLPAALEPALGQVREWLVALLPQALGTLASMWAATWPVVGETVTQVASIVGPVIGQLVTWLATALPAALGYLGTWWAGTFDSIGQVVATVGPMVSGFVSGVVSAFTASWPQIMGIVNQVFGTVKVTIDSVVATVGPVIAGFVQGAVGVFQTVWPQILSVVSSVMSAVQGVVFAVLGVVQNFMAEHGAEIQAFISQAWTAIQGIIQTALAIIQGTVVPVLQAVGSFISQHSEEIQVLFDAAWTFIKTVVTTALGVIQGVLAAALAAIQGDWAGAWAAVKRVGETVWNGIVTLVTTALDTVLRLFGTNLAAVVEVVSTKLGEVRDWFVNTFNRVREFLEGFRLENVGAAIIQGLINGITSMAGALVQAATGVVSDAVQAAKNLLGIKSPSRVFGAMGENMMASMAKAILATGDALVGAVRTTVADAVAAAEMQLPAPTWAVSEADSARAMNGMRERAEGQMALGQPARAETPAPVQVTINNPVVREELDIQRLAEAVGAVFTGQAVTYRRLGWT